MTFQTFEAICYVVALVLAPIGFGLMIRGHWELCRLDKEEADRRDRDEDVMA